MIDKQSIILFECSVVLFGGIMNGDINSLVYKENEIEVIEVIVENGPVEMTANESDLIKIEKINEEEEDCVINIITEGKKLKIEAKTKKGKIISLRRNSCKVGFRIFAPKNKKIIVKNGAGSIDIKGFNNEGEFKSGVGQISLDNVGGNIKIETGAGSIKGEVLSKNLIIRTGTGLINLSWPKIIDEGSVLIESGVGTTELSFIEGSRINIGFKSGIGKLNTDFDNDLNSKFKIDFTSGIGSLRIKKLKTGK